MSDTRIDKYQLPPALASRMMELCNEIHMDIVNRLELTPQIARTLVAHVLATMARVISDAELDDDEKIVH